MRGLRLGLILRRHWGLSQFLVQPSALAYTEDLEQLPAAATPEQHNTEGYIRLNELAKIMKEKIDWEENAARKIADAELSMVIESGNCDAKTDLKDLA